MTDHEPLPVKGYKSQSDAKVGEVNKNKNLEEVVLRRLDELAGMSPEFVDARWLAIGRTQVEKAFMAINRAVFQPARINLEE